MRNSTRTRKAREADRTRGIPVASLATSPEHLRDCADASRTRSLLLCDIPVAWQGQPLRSIERLATGETFTVGEKETLTTFELERSEVTERSKDFNRVVHLRGISGRTFNFMIGATKPDDSATPSERAYGCVTHSPADGERYREKMLIATRKGKQLVQRPSKQRSIEIPSIYQAEQARQSHGIDFDYRALGETNERIPIDSPDRSTPRIAVSRVIDSIDDTRLAAQYSASVDDQVAMNVWTPLAPHPHAGQPLNVPDRADSEIPSRRQIDDRSTRR